MSPRSSAEEQNSTPRRAGMDCRHPVRKDAPETSMSNLDFSMLCWNDRTERFCLN
jgi:hypothetical protein